jgi:hypothetical protein
MVSEVKKIPGYEDYECDIFGNVYSLKSGKRKKMKLEKIRSGYFRVRLFNENKSKKFLVHRLIMLTFHGESKLQVNHIDGNKENNNFLNLEYCTGSTNMKHAVKLGLVKVPNIKGENHAFSKLTKKEVIEIKTALLKPYRGINADLGRKYGVNKDTISSIKIGRTWSHVTID